MGTMASQLLSPSGVCRRGQDEDASTRRNSDAPDTLASIRDRYPGAGLKPLAALLSKAAKAAGLGDVSVRMLVAPDASGCPTSFLRIDAAPWARRRTKVAPQGGDLPRRGVSLHTLLALGVVEEVRAELFRLFMYLPSLPVRAMVACTLPGAWC